MEGNTVSQNPAGSAFWYVQNFSYFQPSELKMNIMRDNEQGPLKITTDKGPPLILLDNNMDSDLYLTHNYNREASFISDEIRGKIKSIIFDEFRHLSFIEPVETLTEVNNLTGRIIRVGDHWGVIQKIENGKIAAWGHFGEKTMTGLDFDILHSFILND